MTQAIVEHTRSIIPLTRNQIGPEAVATVDARELHAFLDIGRDFSNWIRGRVDEYGFVDGADFLTRKGFSPNLARTQGGRPPIEYHLTLDMAKELAMVERNERGREARRYFIAAEKQLRAAEGQTALVPAPAPKPKAISVSLTSDERRSLVRDINQAFRLNMQPCITLKHATREIGFEEDVGATRQTMRELKWTTGGASSRHVIANAHAEQRGFLRNLMMVSEFPHPGRIVWEMAIVVTPLGVDTLKDVLRVGVSNGTIVLSR